MDALAIINTTKSELAVQGARVGSGLIEDAERVGSNRALREEVVRNGGNKCTSRESALGKVGRTDTKNSINTLEALGLRGNADRLVVNDQSGSESYGISD
jgi:hypothetical protein